MLSFWTEDDEPELPLSVRGRIGFEYLEDQWVVEKPATDTVSASATFKVALKDLQIV
jgi:hypothetical protein